jgi:Cu/Ag efflux protein CusF
VKEDLSMIKINQSNKSKFAAVIVAGVFFIPGLVLAGAGHGNENGGHTMSGSQSGVSMMEKHTTQVMGRGRINKVTESTKMINISHEPISELNWPKMRMDFQASEEVNLSMLKPGQVVQFKLQVDDDNNYLINEINIVK